MATPQRMAPCDPNEALLAIGVLTLPVLVRSPLRRNFHRAAHRSQLSRAAGRLCMPFIVTHDEMRRAHQSHACSSGIFSSERGRSENATSPNVWFETSTQHPLDDEMAHFGDLLAVPSVPHGELRARFGASPPAGAGCVFKILSWLQHATSGVRSRIPFVGYADVSPPRRTTNRGPRLACCYPATLHVMTHAALRCAV